MQEQGIVLVIENNRAKVQVEQGQDCKHCQAGCGQIGRIVLEADNSIGAQAGQKVRLETEFAGRIKGAFIFFVLPTLALILGVGGGIYLAQYLGFSSQTGEIIGVISALLLAGIVYLSIYLFSKRLKTQPRLISKIIQVLD